MNQTVQPEKIYRKPSCPRGERSIELLRRGAVCDDHVFSSENEEQISNQHQAARRRRALSMVTK